MTGVCVRLASSLFPLFWLCEAFGTKENRMRKDREKQHRERREETMSVSAQPTTEFRLSPSIRGPIGKQGIILWCGVGSVSNAALSPPFFVYVESLSLGAKLHPAPSKYFECKWRLGVERRKGAGTRERAREPKDLWSGKHGGEVKECRKTSCNDREDSAEKKM